MIEPYTPGTEEEISNLIRRCFDRYIGPAYSEEGRRTFYDFIDPEAICGRSAEGNTLLIYREGDALLGMIEVRDDHHICLFFVDADALARGIGRKLFDAMLERVSGRTTRLEVNSSPFAVDIYKRLGFHLTGDEMVKDGIRFVPMEMWFDGVMI